MFLRAATGFAIALVLLQGQDWVPSPALMAVRDDIARARPETAMRRLGEDGVSALAARFDTARSGIRHAAAARRLQP